MASEELKRRARERIERERGTIRGAGARRVALLYPSPFRAAMSSLGYQVLYGLVSDLPDTVCERSFLPDDPEEHRRTRTPLFTYESETAVGDFPVVAFSVAYELEIGGVVECLELSGLPALARDRDDRHPIVVAGGPLTFSNPLPLSPFVDAIVCGEAEDLVGPLVDALFESGSKAEALEAVAGLPHTLVPGVSAGQPPSVARAGSRHLPAAARTTSPDAELSDVFLVEAERGCSRACTYCVMRRTADGGMRTVPPDAILARIPAWARRVGLVGAAVSDHPEITRIVRRIAESGREVSLSSLRPDRIEDDFVAALAAGGVRTLTTAMDGASERLRLSLRRGGKDRHIVRAAELVRRHRLERLKLYVMVGVPEETDEDVDEMARFVGELSRLCRVTLGVAPFVAKKNTPLGGRPFAGIGVVEDRLARLRDALAGRAVVKATSARWAWVEWALARGGPSEGLAVHDAVKAGGTFAAYRRALQKAAVLVA